MLYSLGMLKYFDDFTENMEILIEVLMCYSKQEELLWMALLLRAVCSAGDRHFRSLIQSPIVNDLSPRPLLACSKDKIAWNFKRCYFCFANLTKNGEYDKFMSVSMACVEDGRQYRTFCCRVCRHRSHRTGPESPMVTSSKRVLFSRGAWGASYVKEVLSSCRVSARHIGTHKWKGYSMGDFVVIRVLLTNVSIDRDDGSRALQLQIPLLQEDHDAAFGRGAIRKATVNNFTPIFSKVLFPSGGHHIFDRIVSWHVRALTSPPPKRRRQRTTPLKVHSKCLHTYSKPMRGGVLAYCSFCDDDDYDDDDESE